MKPSKVQPIIVGGVVSGLLSVIPFINLGNVCCCLWVVMGGALASYLYIKKSETPVAMGEGAILGGLAGLVACGVNIVIGIPLSLITNGLTQRLLLELSRNLDPSMARDIQRQLEQAESMPTSQWIVQTLISMVLVSLVIIVMSVVGGLIGVALFEKRKDTGMPPVPPPDFGNMPR
jgi:hypothetical protein